MKINIFYLNRMLKKKRIYCNDVEDNNYVQVWYYNQFNIKFNLYDKRMFVYFKDSFKVLQSNYSMLTSLKIRKNTRQLLSEICQLISIASK